MLYVYPDCPQWIFSIVFVIQPILNLVASMTMAQAHGSQSVLTSYLTVNENTSSLYFVKLPNYHQNGEKAFCKGLIFFTQCSPLKKLTYEVASYT